MAINYGITADNKDVMKAIQEVTAKIDDLSRKMQAGGKTADQYFGEIDKGAQGASGSMKELIKQTAAFAGISLGAAGVAQFAKQIVTVRKEMQSLKTSFDTLLGSAEKSDKMFGELKQFAATTPLMLKDLAAGAQTMLGFNIEAEKVVPTLKAIGDISMGDSQRFQSLTLAFSQMSATGKLMGQDLLQMINAGFNPLTEISAKTGKSIATLKDEMSKGAISAEMVADAFKSATSEGGKFHGMLEKQGQTLAGQMNQLQGAIDDMFNKIGEQTEGVIAGAVSSVQTLVVNYEKVGRVLVSLIGTYGAYRAAQLTVMAIEKAHYISLMAERVGWQMVSKSIWEAVKATKAYNAVAKASPYVAVAAAVVAVGMAMYDLSKGTDAATAAQNRLNRKRQEFKAQIEAEGKESERLLRIIQEQTAPMEERAAAYEQLKKYSSSLTQQYTMEELANMKLADAMEKVNKSNQSRTAANVLIDLKKERETLEYLIKLRDNWGKRTPAKSNNVRDVLGSGTIAKKDIDNLIIQRRENIARLESETASLTEAAKQPTSIVQDKAYWEAQRDAAQKELEALSDIEAKGAKGAALKRKIAQYNETLKAYDKGKTPEQQRREESDRELAAAQARIDAMDEGNEKTLAQIELDYRKQAEAIRRGEEDLKKERGGALTKADSDYINALTEANEKERERKTKESAEKETREARDRELQTSQARIDSMDEGAEKERAQIRLNYEKELEEIARAQADLAKAGKEDPALFEAQRKAAKAAMQSALANVDFTEWRDTLNWEAIFGNLSQYTKGQLRELKTQLKQYKESDKYAKATEENKKVVDDALNSLTDEILDKGGIFGGLADALHDLSDAEKELSEATKAVENATDDAEKQKAQARQRKAQNNVDNAEARVRTQAEKSRDSIASLANTITQLGTASEITLADLGQVASQIASAFGEAGQKAGGWIAAAFTIADMVAKDGIEGLAKNVADLFVDVVGGLFGFDQHAADREYEEQAKIHQNYIQLLQEVISKQEELMKQQSGIEAVKTYNDARLNLEKVQETNLKDLAKWLNTGKSAGSHSEGYKLARKWRDGLHGLTQQQADDMAAILGQERLGDGWYDYDGRMKELSRVTVEQVKLMKENYDIWSVLPDQVREYYQNILDANEQLQDMRDTLNEQVAGFSFDAMLDSFTSTLSDMTSATADFTDDIEELFNEAIINGVVNDKYRKKLQAWYGDADAGTGLAGALKNGVDSLTSAEIDNFRESYLAIAEEAKAEADTLRELFNIDAASSAAQATQGIAASFSQDSIDEANGRMAALQMGQQQQSETMAAVSATLAAIGTSAINTETHLADLVSLAGLRNQYVADIYERLGQMQVSIDTRLASIADNTAGI